MAEQPPSMDVAEQPFSMDVEDMEQPEMSDNSAYKLLYSYLIQWSSIHPYI